MSVIDSIAALTNDPSVPFFPSFSGTGIGTTQTLFQDQNGNVVTAKIPFVPAFGSRTLVPGVGGVIPPPTISNLYTGNNNITKVLDARQPFVVRASGTASSTNGAQTIKIVLYASNVISGAASFGAIGPVNLFTTSRSWFIECWAVYDPVGPGRVQGQTHGFIGQTGLAPTGNEFSIGALSATNFPQFSVSAQWGASDASNVVTLKSFTIDPLQ
jgi:hypothetical protein